jgi:hypothetical protein
MVDIVVVVDVNWRTKRSKKRKEFSMSKEWDGNGAMNGNNYHTMN